MSQDRGSLWIDRELVERARTAVMALRRKGYDATLCALAEAAMRDKLLDLANAYNDGKEWKRTKSMKAGRRKSRL